MNDAGDVLPSSSFALLWSGGPVPQEGGGLGRAWTLQGPKVPLVQMLFCLRETQALSDYCF